MAIVPMTIKGKRNMRPLFLKFGAALALSIAGFLYSQLRIRRILPSSPPHLPPPPSGDGSKFNPQGRAGLKDNLCSTQTPLGSCHDDPSSAHEPSSHPQITNESNDVGLSPTSKHSGEEKGLLLPEFNELVLEDFELTSKKASISARKEVDTANPSKKATNKETEEEIINLRNSVQVLQEREKNLEIKLLEYYGLKEQETAVMELQNRLKINNMEAKFFTLKIESLQSENQRLEAKVAEHAKVVAELESARAKIKVLKKKLRSDEEHNKELLSAIQQSVANLQEQEQMAILNDANVQSKLQRLKELEDESVELKKANSSLQEENSELATRLESTQILASSILEDPETEELREANNHLSQEKEEIGKELERLRADRCTDVEELIYLRWVNACLRYELRNYQPPHGKTVARDLGRTLSPRSEEKAKQLILEYANSEGLADKGAGMVDFDSDYWSSSQASYITDSGDCDDTTSAEVSSTTRVHNSSKTKFFSKLKNLVLGKDGHHHRTSSIDRSNASFGGLGRNESASTTSLEDLVGTYSSDTLSSHNNSRAMAIPLTGIGARTDGQSTQTRLSQSSSRSSRSLSSSRSSSDIQRLRNLNLEDIRDEESIRRSSDLGSSFGYKRMVLSEGGINDLSSDNQLDQDESDAREKLELIKFAEVLKGSRGNSISRKSIA